MSEAQKPVMLSEEERHNRYSVEVAERHYKEQVYPGQRGKWKHGNRSRTFRDNWERIFGEKK